jgi:hypothetical protein
LHFHFLAFESTPVFPAAQAESIRVEEDLIDQLFNSSEKRLARALLLLARYGKQDPPAKLPLPKVSHA